MTRIPINPELLTWARKRAGMDVLALAGRFPKLEQWEAGSLQPTLRQLEHFARAVHVPIGYLFLPTPPEEALPIPDFRTLADRAIDRPSPNLLDTLYLCQQRQDWYRDYARMQGAEPLAFVGSTTVTNNVETVAQSMRETLDLSAAERQQLPNWSEALRQLIAKAEAIGVLVMVSSIVGSNSHRKLQVGEFRGFALADPLAPLIFINAADSKAAQMFTLAHELVHVWLGESGISDPEAGLLPELPIERWCNAVAAELLMPMTITREVHNPSLPLADEIQRLARLFKVSTLVTLRRLFDIGFIDQPTLWRNYRDELARISGLNRDGSGGGNFYRTLGARTGKRFARAVLPSTLEGQTLFQGAFRILGVRKSSTFYEAARELGVIL